MILFNTSLAETIINSIKNRKINVKDFKYLLPVVCLVLIIVVSGFVNINSYRNNIDDREDTGINIAMVQTNISFDDKFQKDSGVIIPDPHNNNNYFREDTFKKFIFIFKRYFDKIRRKRLLDIQ